MGVLPEFVYLWDKSLKKNQTRRRDGMDVSQIIHFLSFLVLNSFLKKFLKMVINKANLLHDFLCINYS